MHPRKFFIHYLLVTCIGLFSVMNASASFDEPLTAMAGCDMECGTVTMAEPGTCAPEGCQPLTAACGPVFSVTIFSEALPHGNVVANLVSRRQLYPADFLSRLSFSIYRPPIA